MALPILWHYVVFRGVGRLELVWSLPVLKPDLHPWSGRLVSSVTATGLVFHHTKVCKLQMLQCLEIPGGGGSFPDAAPAVSGTNDHVTFKITSIRVLAVLMLC